MEELTILHVSRVLVVLGTIASILFGFLFLFTPDSVLRLSQRVNRSIFTLDTVIGKQPRLSGGVLLLVGATLCLLLFRL
ncbi:MAG: hypothetical protein ACE5I9_02005 [Candidatus Methylomirabilales bacterium]